MERCRMAISLGWYPERGTTPEHTTGIHTRCRLDEKKPVGNHFEPDGSISTQYEGHTEHEGVGLPQFADYQRFQWFTGDRRCYETDRPDTEAWEQ